jgi:hypothetical protein
MANFLEIDSFLNGLYPKRKSLNPKQEFVNPFVQLESSLAQLGLTAKQIDLMADHSFQIIKSAAHHFPENIFWDFDFLIYRLSANSLLRQTFEKSSAEYCTKLLRIFEIFGAHSPIKFRYIHDFIYGYDWLKWMLEKRKKNEKTDPFDDPFLDYIYSRGLELISLIEKNDADYPELDGVFRNPFLFLRSTEEEIELHKNLSVTNQLPIEAWSISAVPRHDKNYSLIRLERSKAMGIGKNSLPGSHKI